MRDGTFLEAKRLGRGQSKCCPKLKSKARGSFPLEFPKHQFRATFLAFVRIQKYRGHCTSYSLSHVAYGGKSDMYFLPYLFSPNRLRLQLCVARDPHDSSRRIDQKEKTQQLCVYDHEP